MPGVLPGTIRISGKAILSRSQIEKLGGNNEAASFSKENQLGDAGNHCVCVVVILVC